MQGAPIPQRIAPLAWRKPAALWTPLALALAIGAPYLAFRQDGAMGEAALLAGGFVYALALTSLGAAWALGRAPRSFREVVQHVLIASALTALIGPYALARLIGAAAGADAPFAPAMLGVTPLAIVLGLPVALVSGIVFALVALHRPPAADDDRGFDVQPFR
jgi:hypothetical protein